jgi:bifunctional NMN adenylyltransferase/nudix hydrolase
MKVAYVIGRFQPFHNGHKALIDKALEIADRVVIVLGDTGCKPDLRDPWTPQDRADMIAEAYQKTGAWKIDFVSVEDVPYDDEQWAENLRAAVSPHTALWSECFLVGHKKDASSFYLDMFPEWQYVEADPVKNIHVLGDVPIDGTLIRQSYFGMTGGPWNWKYHVPTGVHDYMSRWARLNKEEFRRISKERGAEVAHQIEWECEATRKYGKPNHATVDALLEAPGSILLIRRKGDLGNGAFALPGGFVGAGERLYRAALRELHEETGIKLDDKHVPPEKRFLVPFDHPKRSINGRIITNVLHVKVESEIQATAGDDAADAFWVPKSSLPAMKRQFFSDHYHIIQHFIKENS